MAHTRDDRVLYRVRDAMHLLSLGKSSIYEEIRAGRLRVCGKPGRYKISAAAIAEYVDLLEREATGEEAA